MHNERNLKNRNTYLDVLKGLGICLVVFAHIYNNPNTAVSAIIYSFHMPLFFFISGVLYRKKDSWKAFAVTKVKRIVVPYFLWAFLSFVYWMALERRFRSAVAQVPVSKAFAGIFYAEYDWLMFNVVLWFLPVLFGVSLLFDGIMRLKGRVLWKVLLVLLSGIIGIALFDVPLPWGINRMFRYLPFFAFGFVCKELLRKSRWKLNCVVAGLGFLILGCADIIMTHVQLVNGIWFYVVAVAGILSMCGLAYLLSKSKLLQFLGRNTMPVYLMHGPFYRALVFVAAYLMGTTTEALRSSVGYSVLLSGITLAFLGMLSVFINKYVPWTVGGSKK